MTDFKFERCLNDLFCDFTADILNFIVCANIKEGYFTTISRRNDSFSM